MKVTTERLPKSLVALDIELDQQVVDKGLDRAARKLSQQYSIPGFRPGKAPRFIVENYLGRPRIMEEASDDLINKAFQDALKQEQIVPVGRANLVNVEEQPFRFRVTVPVEPSVELADYRAYDLVYEPEAVSEETVQKLLDAQREQHAVLRELEEPRPAQAGDMLTVTMTSDLDVEDDDEDDLEDDEDDADDDDIPEAAFADEVELEDDLDLELEADEDEDDFDEDEDDFDEEEAAAEERQLALVEDRVRPEIYQALLGAQPGETRTVTVQYAEDDDDENLRGREVTYTIEVKNVQDRLLPEWDELPTLANFEGDFDALRANARKRLEHAAEEKARQALVEAFVERSMADSPIDLPDAMIEERAEELFHQQVAQFTRYGLTEEQYLSAMGKSHEDAVAEFRDTAEPDVRRSLVLREIIRREGLQLGDGDINAQLESVLADYTPERREEMRPMLESPQMRNMLASAALDRKLRDRLVAIARGEAPALSDGPATSEQTTGGDAAAPGLVETGGEATLPGLAESGEAAPLTESTGVIGASTSPELDEADRVESAS